MNEIAQRVTLAKLLGYRKGFANVGPRHEAREGFWYEGRFQAGHTHLPSIDDMNAVLQARRMLSDDQLAAAEAWLPFVVGGSVDSSPQTRRRELSCASARQHVGAILRALDKWVEAPSPEDAKTPPAWHAELKVFKQSPTYKKYFVMLQKAGWGVGGSENLLCNVWESGWMAAKEASKPALMPAGSLFYKIEQPYTISDNDVWFFQTFLSHSGAAGGQHIPRAEVCRRLTEKAGPGELVCVGDTWYWHTADNCPAGSAG